MGCGVPALIQNKKKGGENARLSATMSDDRSDKTPQVFLFLFKFPRTRLNKKKTLSATAEVFPPQNALN